MTPADRSESAVAPILRRLRAEPSRTWSIVVTVFGDVVAPRGGSIAVRSLIDIFAGMEIGEGVVRTALSRLSGDGWLHATKIGRNSFYRLSPTGRETFAVAADRIYGPPHPPGDGRLQVLLPGAAPDRDGGREALEPAGFAMVAPGVWIAPAATPLPEGSRLLRLDATADPETGRTLAERAWRLDAIAAAYRSFQAAFEPLRRWTRHDERPDDLDALVARILLIHEYRRVALRDPRLPAALAPTDWPGPDAWRLCREAYEALLPSSEAWLDQHALSEHGRLPPAAFDPAARFDR